MISVLPMSHRLHLLPTNTSFHLKPLKSSISCMASSTKTRAGRETDHTNNYYKLLSLSDPFNASMDEIKRAYRTLALKYHPDVCSNNSSMKLEESTRMFVRLNAAYKTLSDPVLRREYDYELGLITGFGGKFNMGIHDDDDDKRKVWEEQVFELKRRSGQRIARKDCSWGSRMRARNFGEEEL